MAAFPDPALEMADDEEEVIKHNLNIVEACSMTGSYELVKKMLESGHSPNAYLNGRTPLMAVIDKDEWEPALMELLITFDADLDYCGRYCPPPLWYCVMKHNTVAFEVLLLKGARREGWTDMPRYLERMTLLEFMALMKFNSPTFKASSISKAITTDTSSVTHEFTYSGISTAHPHVVTYFMVREFRFAVKILKYGACTTCIGGNGSHGDTGLFVGLSNEVGVHIPRTYRFEFSYYISVRNDGESQVRGGIWNSFILESPRKDWGHWKCERHNSWGIHNIIDNHSRHFRITFNLKFARVAW